MLERLMAFSLRNRLAAGLLVALIVGIGSWAVATLPIDAFPDVTNVQVEVVSTAPGLSPLEIETLVTRPIENVCRGLPGLAQMRSVTKYGISVVTLVFHDRVDIYFARQQVFERLSTAREDLPDGVSTEMGPVATAMGEIYQYTIERAGPGGRVDDIEDLTELRTLQDWVIGPMLKTVPGVTEVNAFGGYVRQFEIIADPDRALKYDLSVHAIHDAITRSNVNVGGNVADRSSEQYIIRGVGLIRSAEDIRHIVLVSRGGTPITIGDVADVRLGHAVRQGACLKDGEREVVGGIVMMLRGENSRDVVGRVEAKVADINTSGVLPGGLRLVPFYERSAIVERSTRTVLMALGEGAVLVLVVLIGLLGSLRGALVVILALPLSALLTFTVMRVAGVDANLMSLGGLAISIGMIIDATIIQVENVQRHLSRTGARPTVHSVLYAATEVRKPSIFGELIIALTFVPILALQGMEGKMFAPLALTVAIALLASLLLSIFVVPVLCLVALRPGREEGAVMRVAGRLYSPLLASATRHRAWVFGLATVLVVGAGLTLPRLGTEFIPIMDEGAFDMDVQMLPGVSLDTALESTRLIEQRLKRFPELLTIVSRTGQTGIAIEARGVDKTGFVGALAPRGQWTSAASRDELSEKMRQAIADVPGVVASFSQPIQCRIDELVAGTRAQIILRLFGDDPAVLKRKAAEMAEVVGAVRGAADLVVERIAGQPYITITMDRGRLARHGLNTGDVLEIVEHALGGKPISRVYLENRVVDITLRFPDERRRSLESLGQTLIDAPGGYRVPLAQVAALEFTEGPVQISRQDGQRCIGIEMNVAGRDIGTFVKAAQAALRSRVSLPSGYYVTWGGQFENQQQAMRRLAIITPAVVLLIFVLLVVTFNSIWEAGLVLFNLPFALIGGVFALWVSGLYLSVPASVGFIVLFGVAVLNGVVLVSHISQLRAAGRPLSEAIGGGCVTRLRPVLMTAAISIFSLIPMMAASGPGSEVQRPLAVVVVGGLLSSTLLTLLVLPVLYGTVEEWRDRLGLRLPARQE